MNRRGLVVAALLVAGAARADEPAAASGLPWFLGMDLLSWDDHLPPGEGVGTVVGDEEITEFRPGEGYVYRRRMHLEEPALLFDAPTTRQVGSLQMELRSGTRRDGAVDTPIVVGRLLEQPVDLEAIGLAPAPAGTPDAEAIGVVQSLAPFAVQIDRRTARTVAVDVVMRSEHLSLAAGDRVAALDGSPALLVAPDPAGGWQALGVPERVDPTPLPNPAQTVVPAWVAWLGLAGLVGGIGAVFGLRRR